MEILGQQLEGLQLITLPIVNGAKGWELAGWITIRVVDGGMIGSSIGAAIGYGIDYIVGVAYTKSLVA